jgi:uncharacterized membrane protein
MRLLLSDFLWDFLMRYGIEVFKTFLQWLSCFLLIALADFLGFVAVFALVMKFDAAYMSLSIVIVVAITGLTSLLVVMNFFGVHGLLKHIQNSQRKRMNLEAIGSVIEKRKNALGASTSLDFVYIELMENYLKAELNQDLAEIRDASERKRKFLKRFYS